MTHFFDALLTIIENKDTHARDYCHLLLSSKMSIRKYNFFHTQ